VVSENAEELRNNAPTGEYEYTHIKDDEEVRYIYEAEGNSLQKP